MVLADDRRQRFAVLGVEIDALNLPSALTRLREWVRQRRQAYVCVAPVSTVMSCQDDAGYRDIVNRADMVTPDGMPLVWLAHSQGFSDVGRTYGPDLMAASCGSDLPGVRHFFYGGTPEILEKLSAKLRGAYGDILIAGTAAPPFRPLTPEEDAVMVQRINEAAPDIIWVGLGSPKQDVWMVEHRERLTAPVLVGVGAAFDFLSGAKPQAPVWMRRSGLEWLFRLGCEPRRLWKRYLIGNTCFLLALLREKVQPVSWKRA